MQIPYFDAAAIWLYRFMGILASVGLLLWLAFWVLDLILNAWKLKDPLIELAWKHYQERQQRKEAQPRRIEKV